MNIITIDYETFWSTDYSLSKMSPLEYVKGKEFELISCAIKDGNAPTQVVFGHEDIRHAFAQVDVAGSMLLAHNNSGFDAYVSAYVLGLKPRAWGCTLAMARPIHAKDVGLSLSALVKHYGLGVKDNRILLATKGKHLADFTPDERAAMRIYNREDTDQCLALWNALRPKLSAAEIWQIDALIRMRTEPQFELDFKLLEIALSVERSNKFKALIDTAHALDAASPDPEDSPDAYEATLLERVRATLASADKFSALLVARGWEVPMKQSPTNANRMIPALAKTDEAFLALQDHEDPVVAMAAQARLAVKSTLLETRIQAFTKAAALAGGRLPIPLRYCGADTTGRDSGEDYNPQNAPRIDPTRPKVSDALRNSMRAPAGKKVVVADQSGIELRVNHTLWKVHSSMALWRADPRADLYRAFAAARYLIKPEDVSKSQRQLAKVAQLGLGFGAGVETFRRVARIMGKLDLSPIYRHLTAEEIDRIHATDDGTYAWTLDADGYPITIESDPAKEIVDDWRRIYAPIVTGWRTCHEALDDILAGRERAVDPWGLMHTCREGLRGPTGYIIRYPDLRQERDPENDNRKEWWYAQGRHKARIYAGKIDENCLALDTLVLTPRGWVELGSVRPSDLVHDGDRFVPHGGMVAKSVQPCTVVDGVHMTFDHEVLTDEGWQTASQHPRPYRPTLRGADCAVEGIHGREKVVLEIHVPVREGVREGGVRRSEGSQTPRDPELRVFECRIGSGQESHPRAVEAPALRSVALDAGSMPPPNPPSMEELRGARDYGLPQVGGVRGLLDRHESDVSARVDVGEGEQRERLQLPQLRVGDAPRAGDEQAHVVGGGHCIPGCADGYPAVDALLPVEERATPRLVGDILNAGPQHRFVVRGDTGPMIVHNCVQHLARCSVFDATLEVFKRTQLRPALRVHDELVYVVDEAIAQSVLDEVQSVLRTPPKWWPELIVWSEGDIADTYGSSKS